MNSNLQGNLQGKSNKQLDINALLKELERNLSSNRHTQLLNDIVIKISQILNNFTTEQTLTSNNQKNLIILTALLSRGLKQAQNKNKTRDAQILDILQKITTNMNKQKNSISLETLREIISALRGMPVSPLGQ